MKPKKIQKMASGAILALGMAALLPGASAHGGTSHAASAKAVPQSMEETAFGREGHSQKEDRTIVVDMNDRMRFDPENLVIRQGETIRFIVKNSGQILHEMVLGTMPELKAHQEMMAKHPGMEHDEPHSVHVDPKKQGEMVWQFARSGEFYYGCLIPGHFEAGMIGKIIVRKG